MNKLKIDCYDHAFLYQVIDSCHTIAHLNSCYDWVLNLGDKYILNARDVEGYGTHINLIQIKMMRELLHGEAKP